MASSKRRDKNGRWRDAQGHFTTAPRKRKKPAPKTRKAPRKAPPQPRKGVTSRRHTSAQQKLEKEIARLQRELKREAQREEHAQAREERKSTASPDRAAAMVAVMREIVPVSADARRAMARDAEKVLLGLQQNASNVRRFSVRQQMQIIAMGRLKAREAWERYRTEARSADNIEVDDDGKDFNPFWYHKE